MRLDLTACFPNVGSIRSGKGGPAAGMRFRVGSKEQ